jgi:hypothetical protein
MAAQDRDRRGQATVRMSCMTTIRNCLGDHDLAAYVVLSLIISWAVAIPLRWPLSASWSCHCRLHCTI